MAGSSLDLALELKAVNVSQRIIEGHASVSGLLDKQGDIVESDAFANTSRNG